MKSDCIRVMVAWPSLLCYVQTSEHSREHAYCHLIGPDDENILSSCIDQFISFLYHDLYVLGDDAWISLGSFMQTKQSTSELRVRLVP